MEGKIFIHHGPYETIPPASSPGLQFLRRFMPALDSLNDENHITPFFTPNALILMGSNPPTSASQAVPLLEVRSRHLSHFHHNIHIAWDIDLGRDQPPINPYSTDSAVTPDESTAQNAQLYAPLSGNIPMKRTVMFEATSSTTFRADPDEFAVQVREFNILDLEGHDEADLQIVKMRIYLDQRPIQAYAAQIHAQSTYGD